MLSRVRLQAPRRLKSTQCGSAIRVRPRFNDFKPLYYAAFERIPADGLAVCSVKLYCIHLMPNHWHSILPVGAAPRRNRFHMDIATSALNCAALSISTNLTEVSVLFMKAGRQNFFAIASGIAIDRKEARPLPSV